MTGALYRLGRFAARRPWAVIGTWLVVAVLVIAASGTQGRDLEDTFDVPGLDSQQARELLTAAGSDRAGLTAHVVVTPRDESATFVDSTDARDALARVEDGAADLPAVLGTSDAVSPDGRVAVVTLRYPVVEELSPDDLDDLKEFAADARESSPLQIEMGGDLFFAFDESETGIGEAIGVIAAALILLVAFGSLVAMGLPIGIALIGLALGVTSLSLIAHLLDVPAWAPQLATMIGLGVGID